MNTWSFPAPASDCHALAAQDWSTQRPQHYVGKRKINLDHFGNGVYHSFISIYGVFGNGVLLPHYTIDSTLVFLYMFMDVKMLPLSSH
jgi:hypothetical protein